MNNASLRKSINCAFRYALDKNHEYITVEHLLVALLQNYEVAVILHHYQVSIRELHQRLVASIDRHTPVLHPENPPCQANYTVHRRTRPTLGMERVLQRARFFSECAGYIEISAPHALLAIYGEHDSQAAHLLQQQGLEREMIADFTKRQSPNLPRAMLPGRTTNVPTGVIQNP